jgi:hypothetical protein
MEIVIVFVALIAFATFRRWLNNQRRAMIHRDRLAGIEKGVELPLLHSDSCAESKILGSTTQPNPSHESIKG